MDKPQKAGCPPFIDLSPHTSLDAPKSIHDSMLGLLFTISSIYEETKLQPWYDKMFHNAPRHCCRTQNLLTREI